MPFLRVDNDIYFIIAVLNLTEIWRRTTYFWPRRGWWKWATSAFPKCWGRQTTERRPSWVLPTTLALKWWVRLADVSTSLLVD